MSTTTIPDPAERRAARRAAAKAQAPTFGPAQVILVRDIRVGDWLELVPNQGGVRGARVEATVTQLDRSWDSWRERGYGRRGYPVPSVQLQFGVHRSSVWSAGLDVPDSFQCTVRRPT